MNIVKLLVMAGIIFLFLGIIFSVFKGLPYFPGDIHYLKENFTFNFPMVTCAIISIIITLILWFLKKI